MLRPGAVRVKLLLSSNNVFSIIGQSAVGPSTVGASTVGASTVGPSKVLAGKPARKVKFRQNFTRAY